MKALLFGNEAIARGAYEGGVQVATGYPGTPSSEILENISAYKEIYSEWSTNEKVAMDVAIGAAYAGRRAIVTMKSVGMNVAADSIFYVVYTGLEAGLVIVTADDPGMFSSQNEQDNRHYAKMAKMPLLEPADSQEAKDLVILGLEVSEKFDTPVLLRTTMRISHSKSAVKLGERIEVGSEAKPFVRNPHKYVCTALWARARHPVVEQRMKQLAEYAETFPYNRLELRDRSLGIVSSGAVYQYAREVFPEASFLKLTMTYPLPRQLVRRFAEEVARVIVIEELDPFLEEEISLMGIRAPGKAIFPPVGELLPHTIEKRAIEAGLLPNARAIATHHVTPLNLPERSPVLCPGCPHRSVFYVLKKLNIVVTGDIGCYNLGALPPFSATHTMGCMGASIGVAHGLDKAGIQDEFVAVIGDSTFFHAGIPPLLNIVHNKGKSTVILLDNRTTAMTGHQDHPGTNTTLMGEETEEVGLEPLVRAMGVKEVRVVDPWNLDEVERGIRNCLDHDGPAVLIVSGPCVFVGAERGPAYEVDSDMCNGCGLCFRLGCPAIVQSEEMDLKRKRPKAEIDKVLCFGCDLCAQLCPCDAIRANDDTS